MTRDDLLLLHLVAQMFSWLECLLCIKMVSLNPCTMSLIPFIDSHQEKKLSLFLHILLIAEALAKISLIVLSIIEVKGGKNHI